jgi:hypothetical protein
MHAAPSVTYPVGRSAFAAALAAGLAAAGLAASMLWTAQSALGWRQGLAFAAAGACALLAAAGWLRSPAGRLCWDGAGWRWEARDEGAGGDAGRPEIALDLQSRLLVRWQAESGAARWLWLERKSDAAHWDALRRAVYSRASAPSNLPRKGKQRPPAGEPPAAEQ